MQFDPSQSKVKRVELNNPPSVPDPKKTKRNPCRTLEVGPTGVNPSRPKRLKPNEKLDNTIKK